MDDRHRDRATARRDRGCRAHRRAGRRADRLRRRRRVGQLHATDDADQGHRVLAQGRRWRGVRRACAARRAGPRAPHRRHGAARSRADREPAAPRRCRQAAGASPRAQARGGRTIDERRRRDRTRRRQDGAGARHGDRRRCRAALPSRRMATRRRHPELRLDARRPTLRYDNLLQGHCRRLIRTTSIAMNSPITAPYGTWKSPISAQRVAAGVAPLAAPRICGDDLYWLAGVPAEGGRVVVCRSRRGAAQEVLTPAGFNVRTRVHEYGGGAYAVDADSVWFSNFGDNLVYVQRGAEPPQALTHISAQRHADFEIDALRQRLIAVREDHTAAGHEPTNCLVALGTTPGSNVDVVLASGQDFYAAPRLSPDGAP